MIIQMEMEEKVAAPVGKKKAPGGFGGLAGSAYVFPKEKKWPIGDKQHARIALIWATWPQHRKVRDRVVQAVVSRYPELKGVGAAKHLAPAKKKKR